MITHPSSSKPWSSSALVYKNDAFAPLFKQLLEAALKAELANHFKDEEEQPAANRKNAKVSKTVKTANGEIELVTSRNRNSSFEPQNIKNRETILTDSLQDHIIGMYGIGISLQD